MRRLMCLIISLLTALALISCSGRKASPKQGEDTNNQEEQSNDKEEKPDKKEGENLLNNYARALILRDSKIKNYYSLNMAQGASNLPPLLNPHPNGYKIDSVEEKEGKLQGKIKLFTVYTGEPYFSSDESSVTVIKEKETYVIDKIEKSKTTEVSEKEKALYMREEGDVKGKEIIKLDELPRFATPQGGSPDLKYNVGRDRFGPLALDIEGSKLAISTVGVNPSIMILDTKKKQVKPLDLFFDENVQSIAWSQDGKFLAVEMINKGGARFLYIYDVEKEKRVDDPMKEALKSDKYSIDNPHFISENELVFNVSGVAKLTADEQKKAGAYKFDVKNVSITRF